MSTTVESDWTLPRGEQIIVCFEKEKYGFVPKEKPNLRNIIESGELLLSPERAERLAKDLLIHVQRMSELDNLCELELKRNKQ